VSVDSTNDLIIFINHRQLETLALNSNSLEGQQNIQDITIGAVMTKNCKSISADKLGQGLKKSPIGQKLDFANHPYLCKGLRIIFIR
jgi:hypothetical protein